MGSGSARATSRREARVQFNKYESIRRIAIGGMAEIHLARATGIEGFEKLVVLKRILPQHAANKEFLRMFLDEGRIAASLHHPNIGEVYDIGTANGQYFLVMEFLHGQDVRRVIRKCLSETQRLPLELAIGIVIGMCQGLHYAHERVGLDGRPLHLVHRDVSPQNVFVTYDGGVKLLDFGVAKASHRMEETQGSMLKGKISYMSPEQCQALPLDRRSDIFAVAIVLWELTLMRRLHRGESEIHILKKIVDEDAPEPLSIEEDYPVELNRIVMRGLARDPAKRYQTLEALQLDLEAFARDRKLSTSPSALGRFMRGLFADEVRGWETAIRERRPIEEAAAALVSPELADEPDEAFASDELSRPPKGGTRIARTRRPIGFKVAAEIAGVLWTALLIILIPRLLNRHNDAPIVNAPLPAPIQSAPDKSVDKPAVKAADKLAVPVIQAAVVAKAENEKVETKKTNSKPAKTTPKSIANNAKPKVTTRAVASKESPKSAVSSTVAAPKHWDPEAMTLP